MTRHHREQVIDVCAYVFALCLAAYMFVQALGE